MTWTIIKITKIDDHQKLSAPIRVAKLFAKTATVFAAESVSLYGNEVNTHTQTVSYQRSGRMTRWCQGSQGILVEHLEHTEGLDKGT